jgi:hypothetical protein
MIDLVPIAVGVLGSSVKMEFIEYARKRSARYEALLVHREEMAKAPVIVDNMARSSFAPEVDCQPPSLSKIQETRQLLWAMRSRQNAFLHCIHHDTNKFLGYVVTPGFANLFVNKSGTPSRRRAVDHIDNYPRFRRAGTDRVPIVIMNLDRPVQALTDVLVADHFGLP